MSFKFCCNGGNNVIPQFPGFPCAPGTGPQWPSDGGCSCCDECDSFPPSPGDDGHYSDHPTRPCCQNGNCAGCSSIAGDAPWLMPKAIGCGRTHKCNFPWKFALHNEELDNEDLPGRPPHTIVCVRAIGTSEARIAKEMMGNNAGGNPANDPCESYDLVLCLTIPVEIIVRDCCGFLYCLKSAFSQYVRIPLCTKVRNIKDAQVYVKVRVRLCQTVKVLNTGANDETINHDPTGFEDETNNDGSIGCNSLGYDENFGAHALPEVKLDILLEACVMRLVPYGFMGPDPYKCMPGQTMPYYFSK